MTFEKFLELAQAQYEKRWEEFQAMERDERIHLAVCMAVSFVFVYGLVAYVATNH